MYNYYSRRVACARRCSRRLIATAPGYSSVVSLSLVPPAKGNSSEVSSCVLLPSAAVASAETWSEAVVEGGETAERWQAGQVETRANHRARQAAWTA